jgi:hypothetical protein
MRSQWLAVLVLLVSAACTDDVTGDESASTGAGGPGTGGDPVPPSGGDMPPGGDVNPPPGDPPVATDKCVDDEEEIAADGTLHLVPGGCALVDDTSQCCLDTTGTKWICTGGDEFPGVVDVHDYASFPCPGL